jgi:hypothetical protein
MPLHAKLGMPMFSLVVNGRLWKAGTFLNSTMLIADAAAEFRS